MANKSCQQIYNVNNYWITNSLFQKASLSETFESDYGKIRHPTLTCNDSDNSRPLKSRHHTTSDRKNPEFHFQALSAEEEQWNYATDFRPSRAEQIRKNETFSPYFTLGCSGIPPTRRLDDKAGHFPGLLPRANGQIPQSISEDQFSRGIVRNDLSPFRPFIGTTHFRICNMLGRGDLACEGMSSASLPRRLPSGPPGPFQVMSSGCGSREALGKSGLDSKLSKVNPDTDSRLRIPWDPLGYLHQYYGFARRQGKQPQHVPRSVFSDEADKTPATTKSPWSTELRQLRDSTREITLPPLTAIPTSIRQKTTPADTAHSGTGPPRDYLVAQEHRAIHPNSHTTSQPFHGVGRLGSRLGCPDRRRSDSRDMVKTTETVAQQQKRAIRGNCSSKKKSKRIKKHTRSHPVRQPDADIVYQERRRDEVDCTSRPHISTTRSDGQVQNNSFGLLPPGEVQHNSRQTISGETTSRMASLTTSDCGSISKVGPSRDRSLCLPRDSCSSQLRINRLQRSISELHRCLQQTMEIPIGVGVSSSQHDTQSPDAPEPSERHLSNSSPRMAPSLLASRFKISVSRSPTRDPKSFGVPDRHDDFTTTPTGAIAELESLENWGWGEELKQWSVQEKDLLKRSWRKSTLSTYLPALKRWVIWCSASNVNPRNPQSSDLAKFLIHLFLTEKLSYSTILVHKSAILTYCGPTVEQNTLSNFIVKHALKAISTARPKVAKPIFTWNPITVINWLSSNPPKDSLFDLSRRTATVLLLATGRRVHDLTLLRVSDDSYFDNGHNIFLIPSFGSKTDSHTHRQSAWMLSKHDNENICPVKLVRTYIDRISARRSESNNDNSLFITVCGTAKAASRTVIGNWVRSVLHDSGIDATPGSCRSAVASLRWLEDQPIEDILSKGNWKSSNTFFNHYCRMIDLPKNNRDSFFNTFTPT